MEFEIISHIPTIGEIHNCKIFLIFKEGIFVNVEHLKIFIHNKNFEEYLYDENNSIGRYITPDNKKSLNIGDSLVVKILGTKYSNKNYSCFGTIIF